MIVLTRFFAWLGRRWLVFVIALVVAITAALVINGQLSHNPDAHIRRGTAKGSVRWRRCA